MIPEKFKKGDTIGLIAPSSPVLKEDLETINNSIMLMESAEFKLNLHQMLYQINWDIQQLQNKKQKI